MLRENNNLFSYTVQGGRRFFLRKMQVLLQSLKRHVDDDRFICGKGKSVRSRFVQSPRPEMGKIHAFKRPCKSVGDDIRPGKGGENGNGASGRTSERSRTFDDRKKSEVGYHRDIGANEEKSRRWKTFPIVWSSRTPVAPTIAIFGSEMSKRFNAKWNAFERSFVSCSVILTSLSPSDSIVSGDRESQSPTTKSGLRPSSSILDRAPSQQTA